MIRHSVILTCYNGEKYILEAIDSVLKQISSDDELIIVDDGSTDNSRAIVSNIKDDRIRIVERQVNGGIARARNDAILLVRGKYVSFIDHDDYWGNGRLFDFERTVNQFPETDVVHGFVAHFYSEPELANRFLLPETQLSVLPGTVTMSHDLVRKVGLFDVTLTCGEFVDFMSRARSLSVCWKSSDKVYLHRRIHGENYTLTHAKDSSGYLAVVRSHLQRNRTIGSN